MLSAWSNLWHHTGCLSNTHMYAELEGGLHSDAGDVWLMMGCAIRCVTNCFLALSLALHVSTSDCRL